MSISDEQLFREYIGGNEQSFSRLYARYATSVWFVVLRVTRDEHATDDVLQETFVLIHRRRHDWRGENFRGWLYQIARNCALAWSRSRRIVGGFSDDVAELLVDDEGVGEQVGNAEIRDRVHAVLVRVLPSYRELIRLYFFEGLGYAGLAARLGIPVGTVKSRLNVAVRAFRMAWTNV